MECTPNPECSFYPNCFADRHHQYWPKANYPEAIEKRFRELPENIEVMCRAEHEQVHKGEPPIKPSMEVMEHTLVASGVYLSRRAKKKLNKR